MQHLPLHSFFYDNEKFYNFVDQARKMGVTIPIIPGIKPFAKLSQLNVVPKTFHCDIPEELAGLALLCKSDEEARLLGIEWAVRQVKRPLCTRFQQRTFLYRFGGEQCARGNETVGRNWSSETEQQIKKNTREDELFRSYRTRSS